MPKRSEQKRENRLRIINAYIELLGQKDLRQITVADICTQAAVARKTLYSHFASKEDILDAVSQRVMFTGAIRAFRPEARAGETTLARLE
ncbi:TetR/AcrR family transcriptional regulator, partial [Litorivivens sp.]